MLPMFSLQRRQVPRDYIDLGCLETVKVPVDSMPLTHFHLLLPRRHPYFKQKGRKVIPIIRFGMQTGTVLGSTACNFRQHGEP